MKNKYCLVGHVECEMFVSITPMGNINCVPGYNLLIDSAYELCPWPSKQKPITPEPKVMPEPAKVIIWKLENTYDSRGNVNGMTATHPQTGERYVSNNGSDWKKIETVQTDYTRGRADMRDECVEAVKQIKVQCDLSAVYELCREDWDKPFPLILQSEAIAAIKAIINRNEVNDGK